MIDTGYFLGFFLCQCRIVYYPHLIFLFIGKNVSVGAGARVKESIVLNHSSIGNSSLIKHAVIGMNAKIGDWTRVEGTPNDPNPNKPFTKTENYPLFNDQGKLNPSITIGKNCALKNMSSSF